MYIVSAQFQAARGKGPEFVGWLAEMRAMISGVTGRPVAAWNAAIGAPSGTFLLSTRAESQAQWLADLASLAADDGYQKLTAKGAGLSEGPVDTRFAQVVAATTTDPPKQFTSVTSATMAVGSTTAAMTWAGEMLELVTATVGQGGTLTVGAAGNFSEITWIFGTDTAEELDENDAKIQANPDYMAKLDQIGHMFIEGSGQRFTLVMLP